MHILVMIKEVGFDLLHITRCTSTYIIESSTSDFRNVCSDV